MKKLSKILASVLATAMALSTVVMPMTAEAADIDYGTKVQWWDFSDASTIESFVTPGSRTGSITQADGFGGKDASDKVALVTGGQDGHNTSKGGGSAAYTSSILTVETDVYVGTGNNFMLYSGSAGGGDNGKRYGIQFTGGKLVQVIPWTYTDIPGQTGINMDAWHKIAIEWNGEDGNVYLYFDGELVHTFANALTVGSTDRSQDIRIQGKAYIDNYRVYTTKYDPTGEEKPAAVEGDHTFFANIMTVAEAKAEIMEGQDATKATAHVYTDAVGGTEAADTDILEAGWYVVVTSKSGSYYNADDIFKVINSVDVNSVVYEGTTVTGTVTNYVDAVIPSMTMILVQDGGKIVYSSETVTNIAKGTTTFTIEGVDSLNNAKVFFVNDWTDPYAVIDSLYDVK